MRTFTSRHWLLVISLGLGIAVSAIASVAHACKRAPRKLSRQVLLPSGTRDFPVAGKIRVLLTGGWNAVVLGGLAAEYRLVDSDDVPVATSFELQGTMLTLTPKRPLRPNARYTLERLDAFLDGQRLDDDQRWRLARFGVSDNRWRTRRFSDPPDGPVPWTKRWAVDSEFETGAGGSVRELPELQIVGTKLYFQYGGGDCGPGGAGLMVSYRPEDSLLPTDVLALEIRGEGVVRYSASPSPRKGSEPHEEAVDPQIWVSQAVWKEDSVRLGQNPPIHVRLISITAEGRETPAGGWTRVNADYDQVRAERYRPVLDETKRQWKIELERRMKAGRRFLMGPPALSR